MSEIYIFFYTISTKITVEDGDGGLTVLTHIGASHNRGLISAPKKAKISSCAL